MLTSLYSLLYVTGESYRFSHGDEPKIIDLRLSLFRDSSLHNM